MADNLDTRQADFLRAGALNVGAPVSVLPRTAAVGSVIAYTPRAGVVVLMVATAVKSAGNDVTWTRVGDPQWTSLPYLGSLPSGKSPGDIITYAPAASTVWLLVADYNPTSVMRWYYLGGPPLIKYAAGTGFAAETRITDGIAVPYDGSYIINAGMNVQLTSAGTGDGTFYVKRETTATVLYSTGFRISTQYEMSTIEAGDRPTSLTAGWNIYTTAALTAGTGSAGSGWLTLTPQYINGPL